MCKLLAWFAFEGCDTTAHPAASVFGVGVCGEPPFSLVLTETKRKVEAYFRGSTLTHHTALNARPLATRATPHTG